MRRVSVRLVLCALLAVEEASAAGSKSAVRIEVQGVKATASLVSLQGQKWLVTAYHNFKNASRSPGKWRDGALVYTRPAAPFALSRITDPAACVVPELGVLAARISSTPDALSLLGQSTFAALTAASPKQGDAVVAFGNPKMNIIGQTSTPFNYPGHGHVGMETTPSQALPDSAVEASAQNTPLLLIDGLVVTYGFSGGPVFLESKVDQQLGGMIQGGDPDTKTKSWAIPASAIFQALQGAQSRCKGMDERDGFHTSLYGSEDQSLIEITGVTPNPLEFALGENTRIEALVEYPSGASANNEKKLRFIPRVEALPGLTHVAGMDAVTFLDNDTATFSMVVRADADIGQVKIPVSVVADDGSKIYDLYIEARVSTAPYVRLGASLGATLPVSSGAGATGSYIGKVMASGSVSFPLGKRGTVVALVGDIGAAYLYSSHRTFAPDAETVLASEPAKLTWGPTGQVLVEFHVGDYSLVGFRGGVGVGYEYFGFTEPASASASTAHHQWSLLLHAGPTFFVTPFHLPLRLIGAYRTSVTPDRRYVTPTSLEAVPEGGELAAGVAVGAEYEL